MLWKNESVLKLIKQNDIEDPIAFLIDIIREKILIAFEKGWSGPPFNPIKLAQLLKIDILPNQSVLDARLVSQKGSNVRIEYNPYQRDTRMNFSIAHEIAHTLFPDYHLEIRNREDNPTIDNKELEFLCNIVAAEILLPYSEFSKEANAVPLELKSFLDISNKYAASLEAVFLRFCDVVNKPCAVIIATFDDNLKNLDITYFKKSRHFNINLGKKIKIPHYSKAYNCVNSGWSDEAMEVWPAFNTNYKFYYIGLPPIKKSRNQRVGILFKPEIVNESEISLKEILGDATQPRGEGNKIIAQVLNTSGGLGFGFGKAITKRFPESKKNVQDWIKSKEYVLGNTRLIKVDEEIFVFQMIAQKGLYAKGDETLIKYSILRKCLKKLAEEAEKINATVHMPRIGAGQGKGDWEIIEGIIRDELIQNDISVTVYTLPGQELKKNKEISITLFNN